MNDQEYLIKKAKIENGCNLTVEYTLTEPDGDESVSSHVTLTSQRNIHQDLKDAFNALVPHFCLLTESIEWDEIELFNLSDDPSIIKFEVRSFSLGGDGDHAGVTISGLKKLKGKKVLNLNTPFTKFDEEFEQSGYPYLFELGLAVNRCKSEVIEFINGKFAPNPQLELFLEPK